MRSTETKIDENLRGIVARSVFPCALLDREQRYLLHSERWLEAYNLGDQDLVGRHHHEVFPELSQEWARIFERCLSGATESAQGARFRRPDGGLEYLDWEVHPWRAPGGDIGGVVILTRVITAEKKAEKELRRVHSRLAEAQRLARIGYWEWRLADNFVTWSDEVYAIFGVDTSVVPLSFESYFSAIPEEQQELVTEYVEDAIAAGGHFYFEHGIVCPDGTKKHVAIDGRIVHNEAGKAITLLGAAQDVTERHQLEAQLRESQKMEATGQLAGGVAHDFNNILTAIFSFSEFALSSLHDPAAAAKDIREVLRAAEQAKTLTQQLLAFSRRQPVIPQVLQINERVQSIDAMIRRILGEDISYATHLDEELWNTRIDPSALEQVIVNLAVNARDAMPTGGRLTIETSNVVLGEVEVGAKGGKIPQGDYVSFSLSDDGHGMSDDVRQKIFEPFYTTKGPGSGTGLGLSTCYGIIRQANGFMWVYSEPGHGTTFRVYLPRVYDAVRPVQSTVPEIALGGDATILVAEDNHQVRQLTVRTLKELGYKVLVGASAEDALEVISDLDIKIDLLVTDVVMPGMDGKQLSEVVLQRHPNARVLFMSGYSEKTIVHQGELPENTELLQKPFTPLSLAERVRAVLDKPPQS